MAINLKDIAPPKKTVHILGVCNLFFAIYQGEHYRIGKIYGLRFGIRAVLRPVP